MLSLGWAPSPKWLLSLLKEAVGWQTRTGRRPHKDEGKIDEML